MNNLKIPRLTLRLFSQVYSARYSKAGSCQVHGDFLLYNGHANTENPLFRKQLMHFNIYITGCYFHICFIIVTTLALAISLYRYKTY